MAKSRIAKVKGTKDFLIAAVFCGFVCLWSISDAWFPTKRVLEKHPQEFAVTIGVSGVVQDIPVEVGQVVGGEQVLLQLNPEHFEEAVVAAEDAYKAARGGDEDVLEEKRRALLDARETLNAATVSCDQFVLETSHGESPLHGKVLEILTEPATEVTAGDVVMMVQPKDGFYLFNKTLSVLMFVLTAVFLFFHRVASK